MVHWGRHELQKKRHWFKDHKLEDGHYVDANKDLKNCGLWHKNTQIPFKLFCNTPLLKERGMTGSLKSC